MPQTVVTEDTFELIRAIARNAVVTAADTGELPPGFTEPLDKDDLVREVDAFLERRKPDLVGMGFDAAAGVLEALLFPDEPLDKYEARVRRLSDAELVALHGLRASEAQARKLAIVDGRKRFVNDLRATGLTLLRGAVAAGLAAALGLS